MEHGRHGNGVDRAEVLPRRLWMHAADSARESAVYVNLNGAGRRVDGERQRLAGVGKNDAHAIPRIPCIAPAPLARPVLIDAVQHPVRVVKARLGKCGIVAEIETPRRVERCRTSGCRGVRLLRGRGRCDSDGRQEYDDKAKPKHAPPAEHAGP